ncbi:MAG: spermidine synthase [Sulfurovaceae bacterium]|nr:spermidine synthase [Sulfurovaceae bacterium]MDD5549303.1 spermidine synthase [Sulfurovaceae bacterium]
MSKELNSYFEMLVHIPMCTHANPKNILIISNDSENFIIELKKYIDLNISICKTSEAIGKLTDMNENDLDLLIVDDEKLMKDKIFCGLSKRVLGARGVMSAKSSSLSQNTSDAKIELENLGESFRILMPYSFMVDDKTSFAYLASGYYHPTADINLQRADLTEGFTYYNSDIAIAAFSMPNFIRKEYLGLIKS